VGCGDVWLCVGCVCCGVLLCVRLMLIWCVCVLWCWLFVVW
jgi:hypothetical protein